MCAQVEIVEFVIDELEGQHERSLWRIGFCLEAVAPPGFH
jgi:hypothetical protein